MAIVVIVPACFLGQSFRKGEKLDFTVVVKAVPDETGDWAETKRAAAKLVERYPAED